jgi:TetR/AcrR family transcriptional repressor of bet genes
MLDTTLTAPPEQEAQRRRLILNAVIECVSDGGIDGATIRRVAKHAGVSTGMVSYYYPTKKDLIAATIDAAVADLQARVLTESGDGPGFERLLKTAEVLILNPGENFPPMSFWMEFWAAATREPHLGERFMRALASNHEAYRAALAAETQRSGLLRSNVDIELAINMISSLLRGLRIEASLGKSPDLALRVFHFALQLLLAEGAQLAMPMPTEAPVSPPRPVERTKREEPAKRKRKYALRRN